MKAFLFIQILAALMFASCINAQTSGSLVTFTNLQGKIIKDAHVIRLEPYSILFRTNDDYGREMFTNLTQPSRDLFQWTPDSAGQIADHIKQEKLVENQKLAAQANAARLVEARRQLIQHIQDSAAEINCEILQHITPGLLVQCYPRDDDQNFITFHWTAASKKIIDAMTDEQHHKLTREMGSVLLIDFSAGKAMADGVGFRLIAYPLGTYEYTTVMGGSKTVRKYTASLERAIEAASPDQ